MSGHIPCPQCKDRHRDRKGDNLYIYPDGHGFCFACGYRVNAPIKKRLEALVDQPMPDKIQLPTDSTSDLPASVLEWLGKYGIKQHETRDFDMLWSPTNHWLIFPIYNDTFKETLIGYQARNFGTWGTKYYTRGTFEKIVNFYGNLQKPEKSVILVEDMISAVKVSRQFRVMPILGSFLTRERANRLRLFFDRLIFWLDYDKAVSAFHQATRMKQEGWRTSVIVTAKDPKEYTDEEIASIVNNDFESDLNPCF
jgi:hypothetical protein